MLNSNLGNKGKATLLGQVDSPSTANTLVTIDIGNWKSQYNALIIEVGKNWGWSYSGIHYNGTKAEKRIDIGDGKVVDVRVQSTYVTCTSTVVLQGDTSGKSDKIKVYGIK